jgi:hypothetical protein
MEVKKDYEGFVRYIEDLETRNIAYSKKDMYRIARKYNVEPCDENCWHFRWSKCKTKDKNGICDDQERRIGRSGPVGDISETMDE